MMRSSQTDGERYELALEDGDGESSIPKTRLEHKASSNLSSEDSPKLIKNISSCGINATNSAFAPKVFAIHIDIENTLPEEAASDLVRDIGQNDCPPSVCEYEENARKGEGLQAPALHLGIPLTTLPAVGVDHPLTFARLEYNNKSGSVVGHSLSGPSINFTAKHNDGPSISLRNHGHGNSSNNWNRNNAAGMSEQMYLNNGFLISTNALNSQSMKSSANFVSFKGIGEEKIILTPGWTPNSGHSSNLLVSTAKDEGGLMVPPAAVLKAQLTADFGGQDAIRKIPEFKPADNPFLRHNN